MVWLKEGAKLGDHLVERVLPHLVSLQELDVTEVVQAVLPEHASARLVRGAALDGEPRLPRVGLNCGRHLCARAFELRATVVVVHHHDEDRGAHIEDSVWSILKVNHVRNLHRRGATVVLGAVWQERIFARFALLASLLSLIGVTSQIHE